MPQKLENIKDIKVVQDTEENKVNKDFTRMIQPENRQKIVTQLDEFLASSGMDLYEGILGFTDLFNTIFINTLSQNIDTEEGKIESNDRINDLRSTISGILNTRKTNFVAEDMITLISLLAEAVIISISEDAGNNNIVETQSV